jgi:hypothetical protein
MAMLLPLDIALEMWLFQEPQWEAPEAPGSDSATAPAPATVADGVESEPVFTGYCIVPKCFWHFEDNAFSLPWHGTRDEDDQDRLHELQQRRAPDAR